MYNYFLLIKKSIKFKLKIDNSVKLFENEDKLGYINK